ncbi:MAG: helix-turn-helix transcriptional regulator [Symploca sp. SIO1B1]|nr:helix-turn-helix transcriptional regulator [Symploca sp. SIO1B1]
MIRWKLRELMARVKITNRELAQYLGVHETSVSRMKNTNKMPRMDGDSIDALCVALTKICVSRGIPGKITPADLLEFTMDNEEAVGND